MADFNKAAYDAAYHKQALQQFNLKLNRVHDADLIEHLEKQSNRQAYLKELIRADMRKENPNGR